jgi:hypothetical protein
MNGPEHNIYHMFEGENSWLGIWQATGNWYASADSEWKATGLRLKASGFRRQASGDRRESSII